jgi:Uma2 family endonuclease
LDISKLAQELAQLGARLFPDDLRLQQAARVLAPPVVSVYTPQAKGLAASRRWFREHAHQYKGQWVAVRGTDKGEVIMTSPAIDRHQDLSGFLKSVGRSFVEIHQLGVVRSAPFQMKLKHGREPDLLFIATEHLDRLKETYLDGPADLVVEIMSPESVGRDRGDKFYEYEAGGVPEYWLIDPQRRRFEAYGLETPGHYTLRFEGEKGRYASLHLPGFWLDVTWLWQDPLPHPLEVLGEIANVDATLMQQFMQALKGGSEQDAG